ALVSARLVRGESEDQHLLRRAGEILTGVVDSVRSILNGVDLARDIQAPLIAPRVLLVAGPQRDFVELQVFVPGVAEDHGAEPSISYRERLALPVRGRLMVMQGEALARRDGGQGKRDYPYAGGNSHGHSHCAPSARGSARSRRYAIQKVAAFRRH